MLQDLIVTLLKSLLAVDSTCASRYLTRPLEFGADIVMRTASEVPQRALRPLRPAP